MNCKLPAGFHVWCARLLVTLKAHAFAEMDGMTWNTSRAPVVMMVVVVAFMLI